MNRDSTTAKQSAATDLSEQNTNKTHRPSLRKLHPSSLGQPRRPYPDSDDDLLDEMLREK